MNESRLSCQQNEHGPILGLNMCCKSASAKLKRLVVLSSNKKKQETYVFFYFPKYQKTHKKIEICGFHEICKNNKGGKPWDPDSRYINVCGVV